MQGTLGLPPGLNTSPLDFGDLLGFVPGLNCGTNIGSGFIESAPSSSHGPCPVLPVVIPTLVLVAESSSSKDKNKPSDKCRDSDRDYNTICQQHGEKFIQGWQCEGDYNCCLAKERIFTDNCYARNTWGVREYEPWTDNTLFTPRAASCRK